MVDLSAVQAPTLLIRLRPLPPDPHRVDEGRTGIVIGPGLTCQHGDTCRAPLKFALELIEEGRADALEPIPMLARSGHQLTVHLQPAD